MNKGLKLPYFSLAAVLFIVTGMIVAGCISPNQGNPASNALTPAEARAIAKEATIYGFPMVDNYRIEYSYFVNATDPTHKVGWNQIESTAQVYTPDDTTVQTPNSDTPYSMLGMDLRTEPLVLTVPPMDDGRYFSVQLIDAYTFNFAYIGSRATGNDGGSFVIAGPDWQGTVPPGVKQVIRSETSLALAVYRTQLYNASDIDNVRKIQAGYTVQPLSVFLGNPAPATAPAIHFITPLAPAAERTDPAFFDELNFVLQFCQPTDPSEKDLMVNFSRISVGAGRNFDYNNLSPEMQTAVTQGMADAWAEFGNFKTTEIDTGHRTAGDFFGTREYLNGNYLYRMAGAVLGIYGNSKEEALYPLYTVDSEGQALSGASNYTLRFAPGQLPPVNAFWSLTMYKMPQSQLVANPVNRYLINSPMLPQLDTDADGGITLYIQHESPGPDREPNWLPAPEGSFDMSMRLYWPKQEALNGTWKQPALRRVS